MTMNKELASLIGNQIRKYCTSCFRHNDDISIRYCDSLPVRKTKHVCPCGECLLKTNCTESCAKYFLYVVGCRSEYIVYESFMRSRGNGRLITYAPPQMG